MPRIQRSPRPFVCHLAAAPPKRRRTAATRPLHQEETYSYFPPTVDPVVSGLSRNLVVALLQLSRRPVLPTTMKADVQADASRELQPGNKYSVDKSKPALDCEAKRARRPIGSEHHCI